MVMVIIYGYRNKIISFKTKPLDPNEIMGYNYKRKSIGQCPIFLEQLTFSAKKHTTKVKNMETWIKGILCIFLITSTSHNFMDLDVL